MSNKFPSKCKLKLKSSSVSSQFTICNKCNLFFFQEWEALTGQVLVDLKVDTAQINDSVPKWLEEDKAFEVFLLQVQSGSNHSYMSTNIFQIKLIFLPPYFLFQNALPEFYAQLRLEDKNTWQNFMESENCEQMLPSHLSGKITSFQRVLLIQTLRPDRLHSVLTSFALTTLGEKQAFNFIPIKLCSNATNILSNRYHGSISSDITTVSTPH